MGPVAVASCMLLATSLRSMQIWADLRAILPPDLASALAKCEQAAASPVDAMLVTGLSPEWMEAPPCTAFFGAPLAPDEPSAALLTPSGERVGLRVQASDPAGQAAAMSAVGSVNWVHLDTTSEDEWTMIPAENVISVCHSTPTRLAATALTAGHVPGLAFALELGADALVLSPPEDAEGEALWEAGAIARAQRAEREEPRAAGAAAGSEAEGLAVGVVTSVEAGGVGDRVALDFTSLLRQGEGALVGSSAKLLALVHGETIEGELVPARPFRVNAGPVHSYVLLADGRTKYLEEVVAGDRVLAADARGGSRPLTVGRCKVEPRPLLLVSFEVEGAKGQVFLQQAETVRLLVEGGGGEVSARSVTEVRPGDRLVVRQSRRGTHVGRQIEASVEER
uniref:3-dehydroquinate synthase n=2 Tax=Emiliania huxleyi TaxID=2903 RepID=A0A6V2TVA2_EMIHU